MKIRHLLFTLAAGVLFTQVSQANVSCQYTISDPDGDGWGWENNQSCIVDETSSTQAPMPTEVVIANGRSVPLCSTANVDTDGDGWGWENNQSCIVSETSGMQEPMPTEVVLVNGRSFPLCSSANFDRDGDGWGWEHNRSCVVQETMNLQDPVVAEPVIETPFMEDVVVDQRLAVTTDFGGCYSGQSSMQSDPYEGAFVMLVATDFGVYEEPPHDITCAENVAAKQYTYKWQGDSWGACTESEWEFLSLHESATRNDLGFIFSVLLPGDACGSGYYVNHSTFCAQNLDDGAWACEGLTSNWARF